MELRTVILLVLVLACGSAAAQPIPAHAPYDCGRTADGDHWFDMPCILEQAHSMIAEAHVRAGGEVIRLLDWDAWSNLLLIVEFTRDRRGKTLVHIARIRDADQEIIQPVPSSVWHKARAAVATYHRMAIHPPPPKKDKPGFQTVCVSTDGWSERVETALAGRVEYIRGGDAETGDMCFDPMDRFAQSLRQIAVAAVPDCAGIALDGSAARIEACRMLSGDKKAAAETFNRLDRFLGNQKTAEELAPFFAPTAAFHIEGQDASTGATRVAAAWLALREQGASLWTGAIAGETGETVVRGTFLQSRAGAKPGEYIETHADFTQHWARGADGVLRITDWQVGALVMDPPRPSGTATPTQ